MKVDETLNPMQFQVKASKGMYHWKLLKARDSFKYSIPGCSCSIMQTNANKMVKYLFRWQQNSCQNSYVLRQTVLRAKHGKLHLRRPFFSKQSVICMLFQKVYHCVYHVLLSVVHRTVADDQGFFTCHWFFLTDFPVHLVLDCHLWFLWKENDRDTKRSISPSPSSDRPRENNETEGKY